jgi:microcystin synthetase protein McyA
MVGVSLDVETTRQWLFDSQAAYRTRPHELLVTALAEALCDHAESDCVRVELEGHGREDLCDDVDLSRTVGWFTSLYPVALVRPAGARPNDWINAVKAQLRAVPHGGVGFGVLRWLASDAAVRDRLAAVPRPSVSFNYLGQFDHVLPDNAAFTLAAEATGPNRGPRGARPHVWEIIAHVRGGQLHVEWHYSNNLHRRETVARLAGEHLDILRRLVEHCLSPDAGGVTPSDFPLADIDQEDVDRLAALLDESDGNGGATL